MQLKWLPDIFQAPYVWSKISYSSTFISVDQGLWLMGTPPSSVLYSAPRATNDPAALAPPIGGWNAVTGKAPPPILSNVSPLPSTV